MGVYVSKVKEAEANLHLVGGGRERVASPGGLKTRDVCKIGERGGGKQTLYSASVR